MPRRNDIEVTQGETRAITRTLRHPETDEVMNLTGCTVTFYLIDAQHWLGHLFDPPYPGQIAVTTAGILKVDGASVTVTGATTGAVSWSPDTDDLDTPGAYRFQFKVVDGSSKITYTPRLDPDGDILYVRPGLDSLT